MEHAPLAQWLNQFIGRRRAFRSARAFSKAAGLGPNTVQALLNGRPVTPATLIKLADTAQTSRLEAFIAAGWLRPEDVDGCN